MKNKNIKAFESENLKKKNIESHQDFCYKKPQRHWINFNISVISIIINILSRNLSNMLISTGLILKTMVF